LLQVKVIAGMKKGIVTVEWEASPAGDVIADSVVALIMHAQSSGASIRLTSKPCRHPRDTSLEEGTEQKKVKSEVGGSDLVNSRLRFVCSLLKEHFQNVEAVYEASRATYEIETDAGLEDGVLDDEGKLKCSVTVEFDDSAASLAKISVECTDKKISTNIQAMLQNVITAASAVKTRQSD
jgi:Pre-mRNA 3'-end-processing endonuclease polyadenylation factor C-term